MRMAVIGKTEVFKNPHSDESIVRVNPNRRQENSQAKENFGHPSNGGDTTSPHVELQILRKMSMTLQIIRKNFMKTETHVLSLTLT